MLDGNSGILYIKPSVDVQREYERLSRQYNAFRRELMAHPAEHAATHDGHRVQMLANIALQNDIDIALKYGAEGVGLFRSEFSFLTYEDFPDENEQVAIYNRLLKPMGNRPVTIRTLDIGADKYPSYMRVPREDNPFLGWRSIRVSLEMPSLFKLQLRAILRSAARHNVRILFPMISSMDELRAARELLTEAKTELEPRRHRAQPQYPGWRDDRSPRRGLAGAAPDQRGRLLLDRDQRPDPVSFSPPTATTPKLRSFTSRCIRRFWQRFRRSLTSPTTPAKPFASAARWPAIRWRRWCWSAWA